MTHEAVAVLFGHLSDLNFGLSRDAMAAMDGSHIPIPSPSERDRGAYYNYKGFYSVILLAIIDNAGMFRWINCGTPGSAGDAGVWRWCKQSKRIAAEQLKPESQRTQVCSERCILGDSAFGNLPWLRTPWDSASSRAQRFFNYVHSQTRFIVEHAFDRLKVTVFTRVRFAPNQNLQR